MKHLSRLLALLAVVTFAGCASLEPSADAVAVRAEQTVATAFNVFDAFLNLEHANRDLVKAKAPAIHAFAERLRAPVTVDGQQVPWGISLIQSANRTRLAYKANRTPDNQASMAAGLSALARAANETAAQMKALQNVIR